MVSRRKRIVSRPSSYKQSMINSTWARKRKRRSRPTWMSITNMTQLGTTLQIIATSLSISTSQGQTWWRRRVRLSLTMNLRWKLRISRNKEVVQAPWIQIIQGSPQMGHRRQRIQTGTRCWSTREGSKLFLPRNQRKLKKKVPDNLEEKQGGTRETPSKMSKLSNSKLKRINTMEVNPHKSKIQRPVKKMTKFLSFWPSFRHLWVWILLMVLVVKLSRTCHEEPLVRTKTKWNWTNLILRKLTNKCKSRSSWWNWSMIQWT